MSEPQAADDIAAIARGGRTNFFGFFLRLAARIPFLFIAGRAASTAGARISASTSGFQPMARFSFFTCLADSSTLA